MTHLIGFARGGGAKAAPKGKTSNPLADVAAAIGGAGGCGTGTQNGKKGFQKGNHCAHKGNRNPDVAAKQKAHTAASGLARKLGKKHVAGTAPSREYRAAIKAARDAGAALRSAREAHAAGKKVARNAARREARAAAKAPTTPKVATPETSKVAAKAADPKAQARATLDAAAAKARADRGEPGPKMKARVEKSVSEAGAIKHERASANLDAIRTGVKAGAFDKATADSHLDRIARGLKKDELFAAAKAAGIEHTATTKVALVEHLKANLAPKAEAKAPEAPKVAKAPETKAPEAKAGPKKVAAKDSVAKAREAVAKVRQDVESAALDRSGHLDPYALQTKLQAATKGMKLADLRKVAEEMGGARATSRDGLLANIAGHVETAARTTVRGKQVESTLGDLLAGKVGFREALGRNATSAPIREEVARRYVEARASEMAVPVQRHGMTHSEDMRTLEHEGLRLHFPAGDAGAKVAADTLTRSFADVDLPATLTRHTKDVYLSTQASSHDDYWKKQYNNPDHTSAATGGDGAIVVYAGTAIGRDSFVHEMGHNLATAKYRDTSPRSDSTYAAAMRNEPTPPSAYGGKSPAEDFAESVRRYHEEGDGFKATHPRRYAVIHKLMEDESFGG